MLFTITLHPFRNKTLHGLFIAFLFSYSTNKLSLQISKQFISLCSVVLFSQAWQKWTINLNISKLNFLFHLSNFVTLNYKFSSLFGCRRKYCGNDRRCWKKNVLYTARHSTNVCKIKIFHKKIIMKRMMKQCLSLVHGRCSRGRGRKIVLICLQENLQPLSLLSKRMFNNRKFDFLYWIGSRPAVHKLCV